MYYVVYFRHYQHNSQFRLHKQFILMTFYSSEKEMFGLQWEKRGLPKQDLNSCEQSDTARETDHLGSGCGFCIFTPRTCARGKVISSVVVVVVIIVVVSTKIAKSQKTGIGHATKQSKVTKNYLSFASNGLRRSMSTTNRTFSPATPINHTY